MALCAAGKVFVAGTESGGSGYFNRIDPSQPAGSVTTVAWNMPGFPQGLAFDGGRFWIAAEGNPSGNRLLRLTR